MQQVRDMMAILEEMFPVGLAEDWDNVGLHVGSPDWAVGAMMVGLDPTPLVLGEAVEKNVDMLVTHHPLIFRPLQAVDFTTVIGSIVETCSREKIAVYCAHTNMDRAPGGINDLLARRIGVRSTKAFGGIDSQAVSDGGLGRVGSLPKKMRLIEFARAVGGVFGIRNVRMTGNPEMRIRRVALCAGSGGSMVRECIDVGADVFVSGDIKYHEAREIEEAGIGLVDIGHFTSEHIVVEELAQRLRSEFKERRWRIRVETAGAEKDPFVMVDV